MSKKNISKISLWILIFSILSLVTVAWFGPLVKN